MKNKIYAICVALVMLCSINVVNASSTEITIESITADKGETVEVPIILSGNTGIAGAVIKITYDENLTFNGVTTGNAFTDLTFTPPGDFSVKPVILLWDGLNADSTNGTIANLSFTTPQKEGTFDITASYDAGGIYDGDLNDIDVKITNGSIIVNDNVPVETEVPTAKPTATPTVMPTATPTVAPTVTSTPVPSAIPTEPPVENQGIAVDIISCNIELNTLKVDANIVNNTHDDRYMDVIIGVYKEGRLLAVRKLKIEVSAQDNINVSELFDNIGETDYIKVFSWDSLNSMIPLASSQATRIE